MFTGNHNMQSHFQGIIIPENHKKVSKTNRNILNAEPALMGIKLVRFDNEDNEESSTQVSILPFLAPCKQSEPIFE
tara:strand:- start:646 stop:873 length:228 start_codon:yes stop_codon:yes gene_type:complete